MSTAARTPRITLLGNNSGRNLGDAAILSAILDSVSREVPDAEFYVPSIKPKFIDKHYGSKFNVKGVDIMPWTGSVRLLGIPTLRCLAKSEVALICDGIIFGHKLFSPHNFLITLIFMVPLARLFGCKVVCYCCGIGPFPSAVSRLFARVVINLCDLVIMRDEDSKELAEEIGVSVPMQVTGDAAFVNYISSDSRAAEIAAAHELSLDKPMLGLNITPYIDSWLKKNERVSNRETFLDRLAAGITLTKEKVEASEGVAPQPVIFSCSPMDEAFSYELAQKVGGVVIDNTKYLSHDIQSVMKHCDLMLGMRFHSLVLSSSVGAPIVGLIYAPKVRGYMRLLDCPEYGIELADMTADSLSDTLASAWAERKELGVRQKKMIDQLRAGAAHAATQLRERYFPRAEARQDVAVGQG